MDLDAVIPLLMLFGVFPTIITVFTYRLKTKKMETIVKLAKLDGKVNLSMLKLLIDGAGSYKKDYKIGLIWLAIGLPFLILGLSTNFRIQTIVALLPIFIGIAYLISGKFRLREADLNIEEI